MTKKTYTKTFSVMLMGIAFKVSIFFALAGFIAKLIKGSESTKLDKGITFAEIVKNALALNSDALFTMAAYTVCLTPLVLAIAITIGYFIEKRRKDALLGLLLLGVLMIAFIIQQ